MAGTNTLKRWNKGQPLSATKLNETVDEVNRIGSGVAAPKQRQPNSKASSAVTVRQFKVVSEESDYLVCNPYDGISGTSEEIKVAKPQKLRGDEATRTTEDDEDQSIVPPYGSDDVIYAISPVKGGVSVSVSGEDLKWLDLNVDSRTWARDQPDALP